MTAMAAAHLSWSSLPLHLAELVLAHLSPAELSRVRSVCRSWLASITSPHFRLLHHQLHPRSRPHLLLYNHAVKISACDWTTTPAPAPHPPSQNGPPFCPPSWRDLSLPALYVREWTGSNGLLCLRSHLASKGYTVGCPFTGQWNTLPDPPGPTSLSKLWAMVADTSDTGSVWILVLQLNTSSISLHIYNSDSNQWAERELPAQSRGGGEVPRISFSSTAACIGQLVYCVQAENRSVVSFDVKRNVWKRVDASLPADLAFQMAEQETLIDTPPKLIEGCKGKVLLAGASLDEGSECLAVVWELDLASKAWREIGRAPSHMCSHLLDEAKECRKAALTPIRYTGQGELIVVMASGSQRAIQFDVMEEKWSWLDLPSIVNCDLTLCFHPHEIKHF